jgi:hypothetical protein
MRIGDRNVRIRHQVVVFDAAELAPESAFWAGVLEGTIDVEDAWHMVSVDGEPRIGVQLAPNHVGPEWPDGAPQQIHLDLWVDDFPAADEKVRSLGATALKAAAQSRRTLPITSKSTPIQPAIHSASAG